MSGNLSARLKRIREATKAGLSAESGGPGGRSSVVSAPSARSNGDGLGSLLASGWREAAPLVLKYSAVLPCAALPDLLDRAMAVLCPSASNAFSGDRPVESERLLLFDLETTGLSGGAGTVAFLAAFGRFVHSGDDRSCLAVDQYLLLDYPAESAFLDLVTGEFAQSGGEPVLGSYNGRSFDMQILRTRCIMNGIRAPEPAHLDLVHAARRLWKRRLPSCSLADVEVGVLGLDRGEDLPGSEAPDAWFDFLKTGESARLLAIADHNRRDLEGLAALLLRMDEVARDPVKAAAAGQVDAEGIALRWLAAAKASRRGGGDEALERAAMELLETATSSGSLRAAAALAGELSRWGQRERAAALRRNVADTSDSNVAVGLRAMACSALAADALRRLRDRDAALYWLGRALALEGLAPGARSRLERKRDRITEGRGVS